MGIINLNNQFASTGIRFKVFPQSRHSPFSHHQPEVIYISTPPDQINAIKLRVPLFEKGGVRGDLSA